MLRDFKQALRRKLSDGLKEPLIQCVFGALRTFCARNALLKLEIHKVFLHFRAFFRRKISRKPLLPIESAVP